MMEILEKLPSAAELKQALRLNETARRAKEAADKQIRAIIEGQSDKLLLIAGPCSADNPAAVLEYAHHLSKIAAEVREHIFIILRVFTAKPRSALGYMGLVHEPDGLAAARRLHLSVLSETGLPTADELLYPALYPYFEDIVSYFTVGARSVENQEHRLVSSGLTVPVGMKNPVSGNLDSLANAVATARSPHRFIHNGHMVQSPGNPLAHGILRGGSAPNYHPENILALQAAVLIDTNHANSGKDHTKQPGVAMQVLQSRRQNPVIKTLVRGLMVESYIEDGAGHLYGQSVTDPCLGLSDTEKLIHDVANSINI